MTEESRRALIEDWLQRYGDRVLRLCCLWLKDYQLAEDAAQETFIKAWRALPGFENREESSPLAFLSTIAVNTCKDLKRGFWWKRVNRALALDDLPPAQLAVSDEDRSLYLSVLMLPEKHSRILVLYYYTGLNLRECAAALNLQVSSAHRRLKKAEALLKASLEGGFTNEQEAAPSH